MSVKKRKMEVLESDKKDFQNSTITNEDTGYGIEIEGYFESQYEKNQREKQLKELNKKKYRVAKYKNYGGVEYRNDKIKIRSG